MADAADSNWEDPLHTVSAVPQGPWLPLESNPDLLNEVGAEWGMPKNFRFHEVLGLESELLDLVPRPVVAAVLLFPCSPRIYAFRKAQLPQCRPAERAGVFFLQQHSAFGNACGTIAAVHAVTNGVGAELPANTKLGGFAKDHAGQSPGAVGSALLNCDALKSSSDSVAQSGVAQTACPSRHAAPLDHHFIAFCRSSGRLLELDGTKPGVVDHGATTPETFLEDTAAACRRCFMDVEPDSVEFSLMALVRES
eukprot:gnl/TRDRNA2_/TRDRNA2_36922_c0_seq1.p1 gnl/TRDRNA2_/TRDRNA2_36922_c0~~gnl/TRDRNA2_/TRDRNA2_36922_c0_seq1.p1  ORF type:complete len:252 (+),score=32.23 gnl/TRDRNA2_/TRDRNA2_36922_c0_seq1:44-799(+)